MLFKKKHRGQPSLVGARCVGIIMLYRLLLHMSEIFHNKTLEKTKQGNKKGPINSYGRSDRGGVDRERVLELPSQSPGFYVVTLAEQTG